MLKSLIKPWLSPLEFVIVTGLVGSLVIWVIAQNSCGNPSLESIKRNKLRAFALYAAGKAEPIVERGDESVDARVRAILTDGGTHEIRPAPPAPVQPSEQAVYRIALRYDAISDVVAFVKTSDGVAQVTCLFTTISGMTDAEVWGYWSACPRRLYRIDPLQMAVEVFSESRAAPPPAPMCELDARRVQMVAFEDIGY